MVLNACTRGSAAAAELPGVAVVHVRSFDLALATSLQNDPLELAEAAVVVEVVEDPDDVDTVDGGEEVAFELLPHAVPTNAKPRSAGR